MTVDKATQARNIELKAKIAAKEKELRASRNESIEGTLGGLTWGTNEETSLKSTWEVPEERHGRSAWAAKEKARQGLEREAQKKRDQKDKELRKLKSNEDKVSKRNERNVQRQKLAEKQRLAQMARPDGFRKDIWEAKKNVFDPNLMRRAQVRRLESKMRQGELVESMASCRYNHVEGLVVMTNQRLLITGERILRGFFEMEFSYKDIQKIEYTNFDMIINTKGSTTSLDMIGLQGQPMSRRLRERVASLKSEPANVRVVGMLSPKKDPDAPLDVLDQIAKLAKLHAAGILSDEEFSTKKRELLKRL